MIMFEESFKKFGYAGKASSGKKISDYSRDRLIVKCDECGARRVMTHKDMTSQFKRLKKNLCKPCTNVTATSTAEFKKGKIEQLIRNKKKIWDSAIPATPSLVVLLKVYRGACVLRNSDFSIPRLTFTKNVGFNAEKSASFLKGIGVDFNKLPRSKKELQEDIAKYISFLDIHSKFFLLNNIISSHNHTLRSTGLFVNMNINYWKVLLNVLPPIQYISKHYDQILQIKTGSFFIDGRWVHVG